MAYDQQIDHIMHPILLLKDSLTLEQDAISKKKYYIKFKYDALLNFDCHISFLVKENKEKEILPKMINVSAEKYKLSYISCSPTCEQIIIKNIPKGENMDFSYKEASIKNLLASLSSSNNFRITVFNISLFFKFNIIFTFNELL